MQLKHVTESNMDLTAVSDPLEVAPDPHSSDISGTLDKDSLKLMSDYSSLDPEGSIVSKETSIDFESKG